MPMSASVSIEDLRAEQRQWSRGPMMPRLWQAMREEWQRRADRAAAQSVQALGHDGVSADYRTASRGDYR